MVGIFRYLYTESFAYHRPNPTSLGHRRRSHLQVNFESIHLQCTVRRLQRQDFLPQNPRSLYSGTYARARSVVRPRRGDDDVPLRVRRTLYSFIQPILFKHCRICDGQDGYVALSVEIETNIALSRTACARTHSFLEELRWLQEQNAKCSEISKGPYPCTSPCPSSAKPREHQDEICQSARSSHSQIQHHRRNVAIHAPGVSD